MSAPEQPLEQHSSVKIGTTASGVATVEVKAYTHDLDLDAAREKAVETYNATMHAVRVTTAGAR